MGTNGTGTRRVATREEWRREREALLAKEKDLTRAGDELARQRRALPWVKVEKEYAFEGPSGRQTLAELFDGRRQLIVYHFMMGPGWEEGCVGCSFLADHVDGPLVHLEHHDVSFVAVSRAPLPEIESFRRRMGWRMRWVSSFGSDFNYDYHVSFREDEVAAGRIYYNFREQPWATEDLPGISVFFRDEAGEVFHTYSCYARGNENVLGAYKLLDLTPLGRNENGPTFGFADWARHHDRYDAGGHVDRSGRYRAPETDRA